MLPNTKVLLVFAGRFLLSFCLVLPLWFVLTPTYNRLLASGVNLVLPFIESAPVPRLVAWERDILVTRSDLTQEGGITIKGFKGELTHFNLILTVALVCALGRIDWRSRCKMLAIALGMLLVAHLVYLVIGVKFFEQPELEAFQSSSGRLYVWGVNFYLSVASQVLPFAIGWPLYRYFIRSHDQGLPLGLERHVGGTEDAEARIQGASPAQGKARRRADKGKR